MAVLFPRVRAWKNWVIRRAAAKLHHSYLRFRFRGTGVGCNLTLRATGATTADSLFDGTPPPLLRQAAARQSGASTVERWLIYPSATAQLALPKTIEQNDEGGFGAWRTLRHPAAYVYRIPNGLYHGQQGAVIDHQSRIFSDILDAAPDQFSDSPPGDLLPSKTEPHYLNQDAIALSSSLNYYHWLFKMVPRLHLAERAGIEIAKCDLLVNQPNKSQRQGYAAAGLSADKLRIVKGRQFFCCRNLFVPSVPHDMPVWASDYLRQTFAACLRKVRPVSKAVYLSRRTAPSRRVINEEAVGEYLSTLGVEVVDLGERSFAEQIEIVSAADLIIAPHGAALSNVAFAKSNARLLEIFSNSETQKCFWILSRHLGLTYHYFVAETVPRSDNPEITDMIIPLEKLKRALDYLLGDREPD